MKQASSYQIRLWLDDERDPKNPQIQEYFRSKGDELWVKTVEEAIDQIKTGNVIYLSFDNDLGEGSKEGRHLAKWIEEMAYHKKIPKIEWTVHSRNYPASMSIMIAINYPTTEDGWVLAVNLDCNREDDES